MNLSKVVLVKVKISRSDESTGLERVIQRDMVGRNSAGRKHCIDDRRRIPAGRAKQQETIVRQ